MARLRFSKKACAMKSSDRDTNLDLTCGDRSSVYEVRVLGPDLQRKITVFSSLGTLAAVKFLDI